MESGVVQIKKRAKWGSSSVFVLPRWWIRAVENYHGQKLEWLLVEIKGETMIVKPFYLNEMNENELPDEIKKQLKIQR